MLKLSKTDKAGLKASHVRAPQQERQRADKLGGQIVKGSGCGFVKGDARIKKLLRLECKNTTAKSFRVTLEMITKIENAAIASGELPALEVEFINDKGKLLQRVAILPHYALEMLLDR